MHAREDLIKKAKEAYKKSKEPKATDSREFALFTFTFLRVLLLQTPALWALSSIRPFHL